MSEVKKLAGQHWSYIQDLLLSHGESGDVITKIKFHYTTAFEHGYKHAMEDVQSELQKEKTMED